MTASTKDVTSLSSQHLLDLHHLVIIVILGNLRLTDRPGLSAGSLSRRLRFPFGIEIKSNLNTAQERPTPRLGVDPRKPRNPWP